VKMKFWSETVKANKPSKVVIEDGFTLRLTQCSLGENVQAGRSVLKVKVGGKSCVIASLIGDKMEHCVMELMFEEGEIEFSVVGKNEIHLAGNIMDDEDNEDGMGGPDMDMDEDDDEDDDEEQQVQMKQALKAATKKTMQKQQEDDDDDDEDEEDGDEDDDEEDDEDDDEEDDEEEEEEAPPPKAGAKRPAGDKGKTAPAAPAAKQAKVNTPQAGKKGEAKPTPGSAAKSPASAPGTPKDVPSDLKAKVRQVLAGQTGIKAADFPREFQKKHGTPLKDLQAKAGFKKMTELMKAMPDVAKVKEEGGNMLFSAAKK